MKPFTTLQKFVTIIHRTYKKIFSAIAVKCLIYMLQTLYATALVSGFIWCLERPNVKKGWLGIIGLAVAGLLIACIKRMIDHNYEVHEERMKEALDHSIFDKISKMPYKYLEDPHYLELVNQAKFCIKEEDCIDSIFRRGFDFLQNIAIIIVISVVLLRFHAGLFLILAAVSALNIIFYFWLAGLDAEFFEDNVVVDRKYTYYMDTLLYPKYGKDFRFYPVGKMLIDKFAGFSQELDDDFVNYMEKANKVMAGLDITKYFAMGLSYVIVFKKVMLDGLDIAMFSFYAAICTTFLNMITESIRNVMHFFLFLKYAEPMVELLDIENVKKCGDEVLSDIEQIVFENVTFTYPKAEKPVLENVSFQIQKGEKISIVGLNGAGKTTIVKLICRLYEPDSGEIYINGKPIGNYNYESYIKQISTLFQDFRLFAISLKENIMSATDNVYDAAQVAEMVGLSQKIAKLPDGIDSILSKDYEEGGIALSGGEEQKLALGRMLNKNSSLFILDEPTAAMDPYAEAEFYGTFHKMIRGKTTIYISHRMSASVFSDKILVLENGKVADFDTHDNLLKKQGRYQELFQIQAENYVLD